MKDATLSEKIISITVFVLSMILVFTGQRNVGYAGLCMELVGLAGLLVVLSLYNRRFK